MILMAIAVSTALDQRIDEAAKKVQSKVIDCRRDIHQHPELGNREFRTSKLVAERLRIVTRLQQSDPSSLTFGQAVTLVADELRWARAPSGRRVAPARLDLDLDLDLPSADADRSRRDRQNAGSAGGRRGHARPIRGRGVLRWIGGPL